MNDRIKTYLAAVEENRRTFEAFKRGDVAVTASTTAQLSTGEAYRNLTRTDCAELWRPDCPEALDMTREA